MPTNNIKSKSGFTIIEVVLVLAVAGLIFLMVFIALPALQRSQRDTQRRQDYANLSSQITQFMTSNNNNLPAKGSKLNPNVYINKNGEDPNGVSYALGVCNMTAANTISCEKAYNTSGTEAGGLTSAVTDTGKLTDAVNGNEQLVVVVTNADCSSQNTNGYAVPTYNAAKRAFAIYGHLETGTYCQSSTD